MDSATARRALAFSLAQRGYDQYTIQVMMVAVHPFEDGQVPARKLEKPVRKRSQAVARQIRDADADSARPLGEAALRDYITLAEQAGDSTYAQWWREPLDWVPEPD
jgi:hypothetical protein